MKHRSSLVRYLLHEHARARHLRIGTMLSVSEKLGDPKIVRALNLPLELTCCADVCSGCPIASPVCRARCYYFKMIEGRPSVIERALLNWPIVQREDAYLLLAGAIRRLELELFRWHDFGDFFSLAHFETVLRVVRICRNVQFWAYTRAWRRPEFIKPLTELAAEPNMNLLLSADRATGMPPAIANTKIAWLADSDGDPPPEKVHVVFRATAERTTDGYETEVTRLGESVVCPHENGVYSETETVIDRGGKVRKKKIDPPDCASCRYCLFKTYNLRKSDGVAPEPVQLAV